MYNACTMRCIRPLLLLALVLAACSSTGTAADVPPAEPEAEAPSPTATRIPTPAPFPLSADGIFTGAPQDFLLPAEELEGDYLAQDAGSESTNSRVIELRADGEAYIAATGRISGWRVQYNGTNGQDPPYIVHVVNNYDSAEGASLVLSREWHSDVWSQIDSGALELLPGIGGLAVEHLAWRDASGTVAVEMVYRNLYIFFTGPSGGSDNYEFFANLARGHLDWIRSREAN